MAKVPAPPKSLELEDSVEISLDEDIAENDVVEEENNGPLSNEYLFEGTELNPSTWIITPESDTVVFVNTNSGRVFKGSIEDFNTLMRISIENYEV